MSAYAKTAPGERLTYRPHDLSKYEGEPFCLRITPEDIDLERCFFVYLNEEFEDYSLRRLFQTFFIAPKPDHLDEMHSWLKPWLRIDPVLPRKYMLLRQIIDKVQARSGKILFYINHGPGPVNPEDTVRSHLGTSVFADGSFDDKILDLVLEFHDDDEPLPELDQWSRFPQINTAGAVGPTARVRRRSVLSQLVMVLVAVLALPLLFFGWLFRRRDQNNGNAGGGFGGGML